MLIKGKVKWFDRKKGYGFIQIDAGEEVFVHYSDINGQGYKMLQEGDPVELEVRDGERGKKAANVTKI